MTPATPSGARPLAGPVTLRSGRTVLVRPVRSTDAQGVVDLVNGLSEASRYLRFLTPAPAITLERVLPFVDVDHRDHEALVAIDPDDGRIVGSARFVRTVPGADTAEIAVTIADEWQGQGLGMLLLRRLAERARDEGVVRFTAEILSQNQAMATLFRRLGETHEVVDGPRTQLTTVLSRWPSPVLPAPRPGA